MYLKTGQEVRYTNDALSEINNSDLNDKKLIIIKVKMTTIFSKGANRLYDVFFTCNGKMHVEGNINDQGYKLINNKLIKVFELWDNDDVETESVDVCNEDDRCKKCGTMGEKSGMACVCLSCGNLIWGC